MSIKTINEEIKSIVESQNLKYIRATEDQANIEIDQQDLFQDLAVQIDQTTLIATSAEFGNYVYFDIPIEILFISRNSYQDEVLAEVDDLIDAMQVQADTFYDNAIQSPLFDTTVILPGYEMERLNAYKRFDATLSGVLFTMNFPVSRKTYYCNG